MRKKGNKLHSYQLPALFEYVFKAYDSAWRVAVASEYAYIPSAEGIEQSAEGMGQEQKVIDLAVTSSMAGRIHTVDITDPYNPAVLGVTMDSSSELIAPVTDITISKGAGLVYATAGMSVYILQGEGGGGDGVFGVYE